MSDFIELAQESVNRYRESINESDNNNYQNTLYVAISKDGEVSCAYEPGILSDAYQCILIHSRLTLAVSKSYRWYKAEYINHNGYNLGGIIGNDCHFNIDWEGSYANQVLNLYHRDEVIYSCKPPFEGHMQGLWDAYSNTLKSRQNENAALKEELAQKDARILELEKQVSLYEKKLGEIEDIVKTLVAEGNELESIIKELGE